MLLFFTPAQANKQLASQKLDTCRPTNSWHLTALCNCSKMQISHSNYTVSRKFHAGTLADFGPCVEIIDLSLPCMNFTASLLQDCILVIDGLAHVLDALAPTNNEQCLTSRYLCVCVLIVLSFSLSFSASEVTTLRRYTNLFIIIICVLRVRLI